MKPESKEQLAQFFACADAWHARMVQAQLVASFKVHELGIGGARSTQLRRPLKPSRFRNWAGAVGGQTNPSLVYIVWNFVPHSWLILPPVSGPGGQNDDDDDDNLAAAMAQMSLCGTLAVGHCQPAFFRGSPWPLCTVLLDLVVKSAGFASWRLCGMKQSIVNMRSELCKCRKDCQHPGAGRPGAVLCTSRCVNARRGCLLEALYFACWVRTSPHA